MSNSTDEFFAGLTRRGHEPLLERMDIVLRFDLSEDGHTERWVLTVRHGNLTVSHGDDRADCMVTGRRDVFDRVARGETSPLAAWLRNEIAVEGRLYPLLMLQRLLPGSPGSHDPREVARAHLDTKRYPEPVG